MSITTVGLANAVKQLTTMRGQLDDLQRQLSTGEKAKTYAGLGTNRTVSVSLRAEVTDLESYTSTIEQMSLRVKLLDSSLTRLAEIPSDMRAALDPNTFLVRQDGRTDAQKTSIIALDEAIGLLNSEADGRYIYAGTATEARPVRDMQTILAGSGARDGLKQVTADRRTADLGLGGQGRVETAVAGTTVSVARQTPLSAVFGFKINDVENGLTNATLTPNLDPEPDPELNQGILDFTVDFTDQPKNGETFTIDLENPDGTISSLTLTATTSTDTLSGEFTIGATADETAANFQALLDEELTRVANTDLVAASAIQAGEEFFNTLGGQAPQRVDLSGGATLAEATDLIDGTEEDTVFWYVGTNTAIDPDDPSTDPRYDVTSRIDRTVDIAYGVRANEDGLRQVIQSLATVAAASFDPNGTYDADRYRALTERARTDLTFPNSAETPQDIHAEIATAGKVAEDSRQRHETNRTVMLQMVDDVEGVDAEEVAAQMLALQTRMQASYQTTAMISQMSLVNYI